MCERDETRVLRTRHNSRVREPLLDPETIGRFGFVVRAETVSSTPLATKCAPKYRVQILEVRYVALGSREYASSLGGALAVGLETSLTGGERALFRGYGTTPSQAQATFIRSSMTLGRLLTSHVQGNLL